MPSTSSSSSSSSSFESTIELYAPLLDQTHSNLLPFSFIAENGFVDSSLFEFSIDAKNPLNTNSEYVLSAILMNSLSQITSDVYIPETEDSKYSHEPIVFADVLSKDNSGISQVSIRSQNEIYGYETPSNVYNTPKFSWNNSLFGKEELESESSVDIDNNGIIWLGTEDKTINTVLYNKDYAINASSTLVTSEVYGLLFNQYNSNLHLSGYDHMARYIVNNYYNDITEANKIVEIANQNEDIFSYATNDNKVISVQSYLGKVVIRNQTTMDIISEHSGFDAPFKVIRSKYHNCYLVAGTNILWKLFDNGDKVAVYEIKNYRIADIDCSEDGKICLLLNNMSNSGLIRILDKNIYSIVAEEKTGEFATRFCKYCGNNNFYALAEQVDQNGEFYTAKNYVINIVKKTISGFEIANNVATTTTTTTLAPATSKVNIRIPEGGDSWKTGTNQVIKWVSTESISSDISIELYKGSKLNDIITASNKNSGEYNWLIPNSYSEATDYKIRINWLAPGDNSNFSISEQFSIVANSETATTTTVAKIQDRCIGIGYSVYNNNVIIVLRNGLLGVFDMETFDFYGLFDSGVRNVICVGVNDNNARRPQNNTKIRIFVGSDQYLSDKWDSGVIETGLNSIYYGGGDNLNSGETYYVNLQIYSEKYGWSEIQTREFEMPN